jgi:hypothetical protein
MNTDLRSLAVAPLVLSLALAGCASGTGGEAGSPPDAGAPPAHAEPPAAGAAHAPDGTGHVTFAINTVMVGDRDRDGLRDTAGGWKAYGFDLDGWISGAGTPDGFEGQCAPRLGASQQNVETDGDLGIDNAFGKLLLPTILAADPSFPDEIARGLAGGGTTLLVDLDQLGSGADYTGLTARVYTGAPLGKAPAYDGTDVWPVRSDSLRDPAQIGDALLSDSDSYVTGDTWVGRFHGVLTVELPWMAGLTMHLRITDPVITMELDPARASAGGGTIAGIIATEDLLAEAQAEALQLDSSLCPGTTTVQGLLGLLEQASDILVDPASGPTAPCDGVSIGLGFSARRVTLGPVAPAVPPPPAVSCSAPQG